MTLLPEYRAQLRAAAQARARTASWSGRRQRLVGRLPALAAALVAVGVVLAGVAVLRPRPAAKPAGASGSFAAARKQLIGALGVLRTPQTNADRLSARPTGVGGLLPGFFRFPTSTVCQDPNRPVLLCSMRLDESLIRSVRVGAYRVGLFPATSTASAVVVQPREGVVMSLHGPGIYNANSGPRLTDLATIRRQGLLVSAYAAAGLDRGVVLVPDGIARVALGSFRLVKPWRPPEAVRVDATSLTVSDNVALLQLNGLTEQNLRLSPQDLRLRQFFSQGSGRGCGINFAIYGLPAAARMTWFDARGRVVRDTTIRLVLYVGTRHATPGSVPDPACGRIPRS